MINFKKGIALLMLSAATIPTFAQNDSKEFYPHFNLRGQVGAGYTVGESSNVLDLLSPAAALSLGYEFTPVFGLRIGGSGWQGKGHVPTLDKNYKFKYLQGNLDATFNVINIFTDYNSNRLFEPYVFVGAGLNMRFSNLQAMQINGPQYTFDHLWEGPHFSVAGRVGVGTDIRLTDALALNVEVNCNVLTDKYNSKDAPTPDWQYNGLIGLTYNFGSKKAAAAALAAETAAAEAIKKAAAEKAAAEKAAKDAEAAKKAAAEKAAAEKAAAEKAAAKRLAEAEAAAKAPRNLFFDLDSSEITAEANSEISSLAAYMKKNPSHKVAVTGYADEETGNVRYNSKLSQKRAENVAAKLVEMGIPSENITTDYKGSTVQPFSDNEMNRVVICILE